MSVLRMHLQSILGQFTSFIRGRHCRYWRRLYCAACGGDRMNEKWDNFRDKWSDENIVGTNVVVLWASFLCASREECLMSRLSWSTYRNITCDGIRSTSSVFAIATSSVQMRPAMHLEKIAIYLVPDLCVCVCVMAIQMDISFELVTSPRHLIGAHSVPKA